MLIFPIKKIIQAFLLVFPKKTRLYLGAIDKTARYASVIEEIKKLDLFSILEVGGGSMGLAQFLNKKEYDMTILDISEDELKDAKKQGYKTIRADACNIPKKDNSYGIVVSVASLEHVPPNKRKYYVGELKRVARKAVILYVPVEKIAEEFDKKLYRFRSFLGLKDDWAEEHIRYGLPTIDELKRHFPDCKMKSLQNVDVWLKLMKLEAIPVFNLFLPGLAYLFLKSKDNKPPYYGCTLTWVKT